MKIILTILLSVSLVSNSLAGFYPDYKTLTEILYNGPAGGAIFTCEILTMKVPSDDSDVFAYRSDGRIDGQATALITEVFFGKVDSNIVNLDAGSRLQVGSSYLIYASGSNRNFSFGGMYDLWSKPLSEDKKILWELNTLKRFSEIFNTKYSGEFVLKDYNDVLVSEGQYLNGKPVKIWKHYYHNGIIKVEFEFNKGITKRYSKEGTILTESIREGKQWTGKYYSKKTKGQLLKEQIQTESDSGSILITRNYFENGNLKEVLGQNSLNKNGSIPYANFKHGEFQEYYENGSIKFIGHYFNNRKVGTWKWFYEDGK